MFNFKRKKKNGFSLVELVVVIGIIGVLSAVAVPKYTQYKDNANKRADELTAKLIADAALVAIESEELTEPITMIEGAGSWNVISAYVSDTSIKSDSSMKWKVFTDGTGANKKIYVYADGATTAPADKAAYNTANTSAKIKADLSY